jgi:hypothetical protein
MKIFKHSSMTRGWFVGGFEPTAWFTKDFEVGYRTHLPDDPPDPHFHTTVTEINLITAGRMRIQDQELAAGDIFILYPWEVTHPTFLEPTSIICVKVPSANDKQLLKLE